MSKSDKRIVTRDVTRKECQWLQEDVKAGTIVYVFHGPTFGCIAAGKAVTLVDGQNPFFELPLDALGSAR